MKIEKKQ